MKSKMIKQPLHIKYQENFIRDEFFTYIMNSMSNLDSDLVKNVILQRKIT